MNIAQVIASLQSHSASLDERLALKYTLALLADTDAPFSGVQFVPGHITASGFVVDTAKRRTLLIYHGKLDIWVQPGGHVESEDATLEAAARREVTEETGVELSKRAGILFDIDAHDIPAHGDQPGHVHFDVRFAFQAGSDRLTPSSEVRAAEWVGFDDVLATQYDESVKRPATKLLTMVMDFNSPFNR